MGSNSNQPEGEDKDEYEEALLKATILTNPPLPEFSLFETLLWTKQDGYFLLDKHLARLADSADYFDFEFSEEKVTNQLTEISNQLCIPSGQLLRARIKLILNKFGDLTSEVKEFSNGNSILPLTIV